MRQLHPFLYYHSSTESGDFSQLFLQIVSVNHPQISPLYVTQTEELEISSQPSVRRSLEKDDDSDGRWLSARQTQASHSSFFANKTTPVVGPLVSSDRCLCQCHHAKFSNLRTQLEARFPRYFLGIASQCTNFECCARRNRSRGKVVISSKWLRETGIFSMTTRKTHLHNSLPIRGTLSEGSDANRYAKTGNVEGLRRLFANGVVTPFATTPDGWSLMHAAAYQGQLEVVKFLLDQNADVHAKEDGKRKPADLARVRALVVGASDLQKEIANSFPGAEHFKDDYELSPVHVAVLGLYEHHDKARPDLSSLLEFIDDAENAPPETDWKKFKVAERKKSPLLGEIIQTYTERAHKPTGTNATKTHIIDMPDEIHGWTPFLWATFTGRREAMEILIDSDADPFTISERKRNALHLAAESKNPEVMSYALDRPSFQGQWFDINHSDCWEETPLHVAASGSVECVRMLLAHGANRAAKQETNQVPLHYASLAASGPEKIGIVDLLSADEGRHINFQDDEGRTPIFELLDSPECVQLLVRRGADLSICDKNDKSLLHHAAIENEADSLKILLAHSPDALATALDDKCRTPISLAFEHQSAACAKLFIENDALGDFHGKDGWSLVHHAAKWGDADVLEAVLKHSSFRRGAKTPAHESAADLAKSVCKWDGRVKRLLKEYDSRGRVAAPSQVVVSGGGGQEGVEEGGGGQVGGGGEEGGAEGGGGEEG